MLNVNFELMGQTMMAMDMEKTFAPEFSWAISLYAECPDEKLFDTLFEKLSLGGMIIKSGPGPLLIVRFLKQSAVAAYRPQAATAL